MKKVVLLGALALMACSEMPNDVITSDGGFTDDLSDNAPAGEIELCDAEDYRGLIGSNIAATTLPVDPMIRAYGVNDIVTQDYLPQRTNIVYDNGGTIRRVSCG